MGRWDFLEGVRAESAADVVVREVARKLAEELSRFPPDVEWLDEGARARAAALYETPGRRPSDAALRDAFRLARWELRREHDALDFYLRNDHAARVAPEPYDRAALELAWRYLTETMLELAEMTGGRLKRPQLVDCLEQAERLLFAS